MQARGHRGAASRQIVAAAAAAVAIVVSMVVMCRRCTRKPTAGKTLTLCCAACGEVAYDQPAAALPRKCPACGKRAMRRALQCFDCGRVFAEPELDPTTFDNPMEPPPIKCPDCGSTYVSNPVPKGEPFEPRRKPREPKPPSAPQSTPAAGN